MQSAGREPSMEDILASIKKVIAEEKELRTAVDSIAAAPAAEDLDEPEDDVLELDEPIEEPPPADLGPPLLNEGAAETTRHSLDQLSTLAASSPVQTANPLEDMVREMLRPILKEWLDEHLPNIVNEHVKREISRITGRKL
jgi:cell pole-organizing protein PopZ